MTEQVTFSLPRFSRGFHLITGIIEERMPPLPSKGLINIFLHHTSAALAINENADPDVRHDFESWFNNAVRENDPIFTHTCEGSDDMPAHLKSSLLGQSVTIPVIDGRAGVGVWQGIYLCEFRNQGGLRRITITVVS
jgi:secondary thiamine-phosphate synthase enzyme